MKFIYLTFPFYLTYSTKWLIVISPTPLTLSNTCFKYQPLSHFLLGAITIWGNRSPISFAAENGRYFKYRPINRPTSSKKSPEISPDWNNLFSAWLHANVHCYFTVFACVLHHFYLVDDIYDTNPTFSYQYFIIYSVWYERPICACIPNISPDIRYPIWKPSIGYDPNNRYLEPCEQSLINSWNLRTNYHLHVGLPFFSYHLNIE